MPSYYVHKYDEFGDQVLRAGFMAVIVAARAAAIEAAARRAAPVGEASTFWYGPDSPSGRLSPGLYAASFAVSHGQTHGRGARVYARVENTAPHASAVEFGFRRTPAYRVLGKAAAVAGGIGAA